MKNINEQKIDLNLLYVFIKIYENKSVTLTSNELEVTQSAVSHSLKKLRNMFSDELFIRSGNKLVSTIKADHIYKNIIPITEIINDSLHKDMVFDPCTSTRNFKIALSDISEIIIIPKILNLIKKKNYTISITTINYDLDHYYQKLANEEYDVIIGKFNNVDEKLYRKRLFEHQYVVVSYQDLPNVNNYITKEVFEELRHVTIKTSSEKNFQTNVVKNFSLKRNIVCTVSGYLSLPWILYHNDYAAVIPSGLYHIFSEIVPLKRYGLDWFDNYFNIDVIWSSRVNNDPAINWLINLIYDLTKNIRYDFESYKFFN